MSGDIIDTIDGALRDYETSNDAMRWQPPEDRTAEPPRVAVPAPIAIDMSRIDMSGFVRGIEQMGEAMGRALNDAFAPLRKLTAAVAVIAHMQEPGSHGHCRTCHPEQAPQPLAVNGHDYRRRQRARVRRKR